MKKIIITSLFLTCTLLLTAQKNSDSKINFNVGAELGFATGLLNEAYSITYGATAQIEYQINDKTRVTANSGIQQFVGRKIPGTSLKNQSNSVIPILAGAKYYLSDNFFGSAQLGVSLFTGKVGATKFTYMPGLGFKINDKVEAMVKYTGYSDFGGAFGARVSYSL
jgi:hypothetical protein